MLQNIRDKAQGWFAWIIVILISIPFALWGIQQYVNPRSELMVAEVNGVELSQIEFQEQVRQQQRRLSAMFKGFDVSTMQEQIKQSALQQMIEREVLLQFAAKSGFRISDAMLAQEIHSIEAFQQEGHFSQGLYEMLLKNQGLMPALFELEMRRGMLVDQLRHGIVRSALLTNYDQIQQAKFEKQQRYLTYFIIPTSRFESSVTVQDANIEKYFKEHADKYMTTEKVSIEYVELKGDALAVDQTIDESLLKQYYQEHLASFTTPPEWKARHILIQAKTGSPPKEMEAAKKKAEDLLAKIRAGESFEQLAKTHSDDKVSAEKGGDLGWFGEGIMEKPFEQALSTLKVVNEVSEVVQTNFGFHIIQLQDIKSKKIKEFAEAREQLEKDYRKEQTETKFYTVLDEFSNLAYEHSETLDVLASTLNLEKKISPLFDRAGIQGSKDPILSNRKVIDAAFSDSVLKEGYNSEGIEISEKHVVVLRVKEHIPAKPKLLAEVKNDIIATLKKEQTKIEAKTLGKTILESIKQGKNPNEVIKLHKFTWFPAQWIERHDNKLGNPEIASAVFKLGRPEKNKAIYKGMALNNGDYAVMALLEVKDGQIDKNQPAPIEQQQSALGETAFNQLMSGLKSKAEIISHPENIK